jgi:thiol-disulfide isomerase/thioredoxin
VRPVVRAMIGAVVVIAATLAILVSRHTSPASVSAAAGAPAAVGTVARAVDLPVLNLSPAASVEGAAGWLNSPPLSDADLHNKVVLYDFWTFECINCFHTLPFVKAWQARYAADGLIIVGIHSPEFATEADPNNVAKFVADHHITYPVALDPKWTIWKAWGNQYWPAFYLYDAQGLRLKHFGEGAYENTENMIRALLNVDPSSRRATVLPEP